MKRREVLILGACVLATFFVLPASAQESASPWLSHLERIDNWLDSMRIEEDGKIRYAVAAETPEQSAMNLYHGLPGILLFYHNMYRVTGEERYRLKSLELARIVALQLDQEDGSGDPGLFTGYTGMAWVLLKTWPTEHRDSIVHCIDCLTTSARELGTEANDGVLGGRAVTWNQVTDVIGGSAGIGMFLLQCAKAPEIASEDAMALAIAAANGLLSSAIPVDETGGQKWMMDPSFAREMPNYSHGTAGICDFLVELHTICVRESSGYDGRFGNAAMSGARYLVDLDSRHGARGLLPHHFPGGEELFYLGWCHGPPGTCRFANRLAEFEDQPVWRDYSQAATEELLKSGLHHNRTDGFWNNTGICCGSAGIGSFLLDQSVRFQNDEFLSESRRIVEDILSRGTCGETASGIPTLCWSSAEHRVRPDFLQTQTGLMQGASGVGLFLLQLEAVHSGKNSFSIFDDLMR